MRYVLLKDLPFAPLGLSVCEKENVNGLFVRNCFDGTGVMIGGAATLIRDGWVKMEKLQISGLAVEILISLYNGSRDSLFVGQFSQRLMSELKDNGLIEMGMSGRSEFYITEKGKSLIKNALNHINSSLFNLGKRNE